MLTGAAWFNVFSYGFTGLFLFIDAIIYWFISILFGLFETLASARIFTQSMYQDFANKIYVVIGVVMLFYLTYALLKSLINPDDFGKNTSKIAINLIVSLILLGVVPIIFDYAFNIQDAIIEEHVIDRLIFDEDQANLSNKGIESAWNVMNAFINPENVEIEGEGHINLPLIYQPGADMLNKIFKGQTYKWSEFRTKVLDGSITFLNVTDFVEDIHKDNDVVYIPVVGSICGIFLAYVLVSFCIDLGIRVAKLAFFQIIAPIPIILRIVPEKKSVFDNWIKKLIAVFMEVFIRMFIMYIIVYLTAAIFRGKAALPNDIGMIAMVIVVMGLFAFAKEAPKLISEVIGIDSGNIKLGIGGKLAAGGAFGIGAMLGGGITSLMQNATHGVSNFNKAEGFKAKAMAAIRGTGSLVAGTASGTTNAVKNGAFNAKNTKEMRNSARQGSEQALKNRGERESYRATHGGNLRGVIKGHASDFISNVGTWATGGAAGILGKVAYEEEFKDSYNDFQAIYENASYKAMESQLEQYKAMHKAGDNFTQNGTPIQDAIANLEGEMMKARMKAVASNSQAAAYSMYNIYQKAQKDPVLAKNIGLKVDMAKDLVLRGNQVIDKSTNKEVDLSKLFEIIEGSAANNIVYNRNTDEFLDANTNLNVDFNSMAQAADGLKDGMKHQKKKAINAINADKVSIDYKEAIKKKEANTNNKK